MYIYIYAETWLHLAFQIIVYIFVCTEFCSWVAYKISENFRYDVLFVFCSSKNNFSMKRTTSLKKLVHQNNNVKFDKIK